MESGEPLDWGDIFFHLHKDCGLKKWDIWEYTLPQVAELMKRVNKYIQFEVETRMGLPFLRRKGTNSVDSSPHASSSQDYQEISEDDIAVLGKVLGGL
jgi:hypothetical protein